MEEETKGFTTTPFLALPFFMAPVRHRSMKEMTCSIVMLQNFRESALWVRSLPVCLWAMSCISGDGTNEGDKEEKQGKN